MKSGKKDFAIVDDDGYLVRSVSIDEFGSVRATLNYLKQQIDRWQEYATPLGWRLTIIPLSAFAVNAQNPTLMAAE